MSDLDRYQYGYDRNANRLWKANVVGTAAVGNLDEGYAYDNLNRLTQMQRGTLSGGVIAGTPSREMDYTLDPTGNWSAYLTKTSGTTDLNQTRSANTVNEITAIGGTPGWATPPVYDAAGNMSSFPQPSTPADAFGAVYDAWNRMVSISDTGGTVATYQYDGRNRRTVKVTTSTSETRHFYYTNNWQDIEERVGAATTMDQQYVWGIRYVDELVCRDDATPQRLYACQDANFNLTAITDTSGSVVERYVFDPYGVRTIMNASWTVLNTSAYYWVFGYQGLADNVESDLLYMRNRYLLPGLGRMMSREPSAGQYVDGINLYQCERSNPSSTVDPAGLAGCCVTSPLSVVAAGALQGGWNMNSYIDLSVTSWGIQNPNQLGIEWPKDGTGPSIKVQITAPYNGAASCSVTQTITPGADASASWIKGLGRYAGLPPGTVKRGVPLPEPALDQNPSPWFPRFQGGIMSFADAPGGYPRGTTGTMEFTTCFHSNPGPEECCMLDKCCVTWILGYSYPQIGPPSPPTVVVKPNSSKCTYSDAVIATF